MSQENRTLYITDYCLTPGLKIPMSSILVEGEKILAIGGSSAFIMEPGLDVVNLEGNYAIPGMIDTHIHGAGGFDSSLAFEQGADIGKMSRTLARHGTTSFIPTIISGSRENMIAAISSLIKMMNKPYDGAEPVGIHLEGPYLCKEKHGSQLEHDIRPIDLGEAREMISEGRRHIKIMTFAPELENSIRLIELLRENNITPSMGHSMADENSVNRAVDAGAHRVTHIFNGMPPLHQRAVGLTAIALTDDRISIEIILDGTHLHPTMVDLSCKAKPKDRIIGVSDAIQAAGLHDGTYHIGDTSVEVRNGKATTSEGVLAGTTLMLERGLRHLMSFSHMESTDSAACMTINPAKSIGLTDRGELSPGKLADISFCGTKTNNIRMVVSKGRIIFDSKNTSTDV